MSPPPFADQERAVHMWCDHQDHSNVGERAGFRTRAAALPSSGSHKQLCYPEVAPCDESPHFFVYHAATALSSAALAAAVIKAVPPGRATGNGGPSVARLTASADRLPGRSQ